MAQLHSWDHQWEAGSKCRAVMMKPLSVQSSSILFLYQSRGSLDVFVFCLWSPSLFFFGPPSWRRQRLPSPQTQPPPWRAKRQAVEGRRQQERNLEAVKMDRREYERREVIREENDAVSPTLEVPCSPQLSVRLPQKTAFRDSPNEHSCPHSTPQWSPSPPLRPLKMENIAPIKPRGQYTGVGKGEEVCVKCMCG